MHSESKHLVYEPVTQKHAKELKGILCDPKVYAYMNEATPTFEQLSESFKSKEIGPLGYRSHEVWIDYIARKKDSREAIGRVEATVIEHRAEVAYIFGRSYWGKGYGSESLLWLQHLLRKEYGVREFWATVTPGNVPSKRLLLKSGYVEVSDENLPQLMSYDENDWVFYRSAQ